MAWCVAFAERAGPELRSREQHTWLDRLHAELDNFRVALGSSITGHAPQDALRLASALLEFWVVRADWSEGRQWVERALALPGAVDPAVRMRALRAAGELADVLSDYPSSTTYYEQSLEIARAIGDRRGVAGALLGLAQEARRIGQFVAARPLLEEGAALLREVGDEPSIARSLGGLAALEEHSAKARVLWEENLAIRRRLGNREGVGWSAIQVGSAAQSGGDYEAARAAYQESLAVGRGLGYKRLIARALTQLAEVACLCGDLAEARSLFEETLPTWREIGHKSGLVDSLRGLGNVERMRGNLPVARSLLEENLAVCRATGARGAEAAALRSLGDLARAGGDVEGARRLYREALALASDIGHGDETSACLLGLTQVAVIERAFGQAAQLLGAAEVLRQKIGAVVPPCDRIEYDRAMTVVRTTLGQAEFDDAWQTGRRLRPDQLSIQTPTGVA